MHLAIESPRSEHHEEARKAGNQELPGDAMACSKFYEYSLPSFAPAATGEFSGFAMLVAAHSVVVQ